MLILDQKTREALSSLAASCGVRHLRLFGSFARGEADAESDVDLLADFPEGFTLLKHARLERQMSERIGRPVELISERALRPAMRERVLQEVRPLCNYLGPSY